MSELDSTDVFSEKTLTVRGKITAISEVLVVRFVLYALLAFTLFQLIYNTPNPDPIPIEASYVVGVLWFLIPLAMILGLRRNMKDYGLTKEGAPQSVDLALSAFAFFILTNVGFMVIIMMGWSYLEPLGALLLTGFFGVSLILIVRLISQKYSNFEGVLIPIKKHQTNILVILVLLVFPIILGFFLNRLSIGLVSTVIWQFVFSGFGEEIFFRGYIQSRLNLAFGRPYEWKSIRFGVGLFITAGIFAATHILNTANIWFGDFNFAWWWGTFTFVGGLLFGLIREKTNSIVASGTLHGLEAVGEGLALLF